MSVHTLRLRVNRVEHWRPDFADDGPILTQVEVRMSDRYDQPTYPQLRYEHQSDGHHVPTRLVLNFTGKVTDFEPGDYLVVTVVKAAPVPASEPQEIPF